MADAKKEIEWIVSEIPHLETQEFRVMERLNSYCLALGKRQESYTEDERENVKIQKAEIVRIQDLLRRLKSSEQLLQAILMKHRSLSQSHVTGGGKTASQKLKLSKKDNEDLNREIVKVVENYQDNFSLEESLRKAAQNSKRHFSKWIKKAGVPNLNKDIIQGRYRRNRDKND
jgi:hypothetical protein